jgi:2-dehydro-3-deoxygalactonokinase
MGRATLVAGDWGTSRLRLFLCDADGTAIDSIDGPGASEARDRFPETFDSLLIDWTRQHGALPAVLCGMVGSSFGWVQAPYLACPARPEQIAGACVALRAGRVHIIPGLSCRNRLDAPDLMRGEETQILGALHLNPALHRGRHLLCLPGTHTKWVLLEEGTVQDFLTATTGELFALLCAHSVLVSDSPTRAQATTVMNDRAFARGLEQHKRSAGAGLLHHLFEGRSRRLNNELAANDAAAYLSGLMIASDVSGALALLATNSPAPVHIVGAPQLTTLYAAALESQGRDARSIDGAAASLAGLVHVHRLLLHPVARHGT